MSCLLLVGKKYVSSLFLSNEAKATEEKIDVKREGEKMHKAFDCVKWNKRKNQFGSAKNYGWHDGERRHR